MAIQAKPNGDGSRLVAGTDEQDVLAILQKYDGRRGSLIAILEEIQLRYGYLPEEALRSVSERTGRSLVDIYGIATFYRSFSLKPRGKHLVCACLGTACHVRGAPAVVERLKEQLGIEPGETTPDGQFTLETVNCLGACAVGPVVVMDGHYFSKVRPSRVSQLLEEPSKRFGKGQSEPEVPPFPIDVGCIHCNHSLMDSRIQLDGRSAIRVMAAAGERQGWLWLSSFYGSSACLWERDIAPDTVVKIFCPHCYAEIGGTSACSTCRAPLVPMLLRAGGIAQFCSRRGCQGRQLDLNGIDGGAMRESMEG